MSKAILPLRAAAPLGSARVWSPSGWAFVVWVGLVISWLFFAGVKPPLVS